MIMTFREQLTWLGVCYEALEWVGDKTLDEAWATCPELTHLVWLMRRLAGADSTFFYKWKDFFGQCDWVLQSQQFSIDLIRQHFPIASWLPIFNALVQSRKGKD